MSTISEEYLKELQEGSPKSLSVLKGKVVVSIA